MSRQIDTKRMVHIALMIALQIIFQRFLNIDYGQFVRLSFGFLPVAIIGMMYGPVYGGVGATVGNVLGAVLRGFTPFPGFVLSALLGGIIYGLLLHNKPKKLWRVCTAVAIICIFVNLGLNTYWLQMMHGQAFMALLPLRGVQNAIMSVVMVSTIWFVAYPIIDFYKQSSSRIAV